MLESWHVRDVRIVPQAQVPAQWAGYQRRQERAQPSLHQQEPQGASEEAEGGSSKHLGERGEGKEGMESEGGRARHAFGLFGEVHPRAS